MKSMLCRCMGKINNGGIIYLPTEFMHISTVTVSPRFADVIEPTFFRRLVAIILALLLGTEEIPVLSQLYNRSGVNLYLSLSSPRRLKNCITTGLLKPITGAADVASGFQSDNSGCLDIHPLYQS